ncbi:hypothetical protein EV644_114164 [Kribbella orskensis]|uniref:Uncharacterized protein n=1 Tax=Kribbella orskensis TaxID=2512216 RepID=A0ABY2BGN3_9ACTN|nr:MULTISPECIES: hypothetical protein [Kribbella]TCN35909.1 hypothetical protein EV642_115164 [Kribbella sp. VKM Ac-2500]TCO17516.1 hypothetical protein EV644_114164 [Kribbella orskensis]
MRYLWSVPAAVIAWFVVGFAPTYLNALPDGSTMFVPARIDLLVLGGFAGGVVAGLLIRRIRIVVPLVLVVASGAWWLSGHALTDGQLSDKGLLAALLVASAIGGFFGALGTRSSVVAAFALAVPVAWYALRPASELETWRWLWQLNGLLVAAGLALLLYVACWRRGWRSADCWVPLAAVYVASFAVVDGAQAITEARGRSTDEIADAGTDAFFQTFEPLLREYWPWLVLAVLLAIPMVALKIRALPPPPPPPSPYDDRGNDAVLSDDLDWIDREEPKRRLLPRREPVG